jgi:hypothetical protein
MLKFSVKLLLPAKAERRIMTDNVRAKIAERLPPPKNPPPARVVPSGKGI